MRSAFTSTRVVVIAVAVAIALAAGVSATEAAGTRTRLVRDNFERFSAGERWGQGTRHGAWQVRYNGYGSVGTARAGTVVHRQAPKASKSLDETHASLITSRRQFGDFRATLRTKTVKQLRQNARPNAWETAWVLWDYTHDEHFYYFIAKPNGWELGKVDNSKRNPDGPRCFWPSYQNCRYPGAQRYLNTGSSPKFPVGAWYNVEISRVGRTMRVSVNGEHIVTYRDRVNPYRSGSLGLYNEDAAVQFDNVRVEAASRLHPA